jgi:uncharacterized NAD-dependent epimerase/dehydratase family protein
MKERAIILTHGMLHTNDAKTAHGLIRGTERFDIVAVIDERHAGTDAGEVLDGKHRGIPVFAKLEEACQSIPDLRWVIIGIATVGGILPQDLFEVIRDAIQRKLSVVNGLHDYLTSHEDLVALAAASGVQLIDIRKPKPRAELHFWTGKIHEVKVPIIAVMGTDCALGKRTTARLAKEQCIAQGIRAEMIYTGQTGWLQGGKYGFVLDSTLNDFVSGELEHAILEAAADGAEVIFIEGQASLRNPSGPCGLEFLISGCAKHVILVHAAKRIYYDNDEHWGRIPPVESEIAIIESFGSKVIAVALNTEGCQLQEAYHFQQEYEGRLQLPVLLPLEQGMAPLIPLIENLLQKSRESAPQ